MRSRLSAALVGIAALLWSAAAFAACPAWMTLSGATCQSETFPASGIIVGTTDTQTLSGKTLTAPVISSITNTGTLTLPTTTGTLLDSALNLSDLASAATARTNLGLGALATESALTAGQLPGLASGDLWLGNGSGVATAAALSGDATLSNTGALTLATVNVAPGSTTCSSITTNAKGLVTANTSGSCGSGTVTSVALALPSFMTVTGSPITGSGTLTGSLTTQSANTVFAGPASGSAAAPAFRALAAADIPALSYNGVISWPGTGDLLLSNGANAPTGLAPATNGDCAVVAAGAWALGSCGSGGGTPTYFVGASAGSANAYTLATPTPSSGWTLTAGYTVSTTFPVANTGASTEAVAGGAALPIVVAQGNGLYALTGGEIAAGPNYLLTYSTNAATACGASCYVLSPAGAQLVAFGVNATVTAYQWNSGDVFLATASGLTLTLPQASTVSKNIGIYLATGSNVVTLAPNAADGINGGAVNTSVSAPANAGFVITTSGADGTGAFQAPGAGLVAAGSCTNCNLTVDAGGRVTVLANGSGGSGGLQLGPSYIAGRWYTPYSPGLAFASGNTQTAGSIYCYPAAFLTSSHVNGFNVYVTTADSGGNAQVAFYTNGSNNLPGSLIANSGSLSTTTVGAVSASVTSTAVAAGPIWVCDQMDNAVAGIYSATISGANLSASAQYALLGSGAALTSYAGQYTSIYTTGTFGTWPASLTSATWTYGANAWGPWLQFDVASVP